MWGSDIRPHREVCLRLGEAQTGLQQGRSRVQSESRVPWVSLSPQSCDFLSCKNKSSDSALETAAGPGKDHLVLMVSVTEFSRRQGEPSASLKMSDAFSSRLQDAQGEAGRLQRTGVYSG